jgi:hypothetical protein
MTRNRLLADHKIGPPLPADAETTEAEGKLLAVWQAGQESDPLQVLR